jgi:hypothetical protein
MKLKQQLSLGLLFIMLSACGGDSTNNTDAVNESINLEKICGITFIQLSEKLYTNLHLR